MAGFTVATIIAISVDRLLALLLGISAVLWFLWLTTSSYCYVQIYLVLRNHIQAQVTLQGQPNAISALNLSRYKKTVSTTKWVFATMMICYFPFGLVMIFTAAFDSLHESLVIITFVAITLLYLNSSLNPIPYCWKMRELRYVIKEILRNSGFCK
ncbi:hypothetical protein ACROYT_G003376 [Oculina patagonica]